MHRAEELFKITNWVVTPRTQDLTFFLSNLSLNLLFLLRLYDSWGGP